MNRWIAPIATLVALTVWLAWPDGPPAPEAPSGPTAVAFRLAPGTAYQYRLALEGQKSVPGSAGEAFGGSMDLDVDLELLAYPTTGVNQLVGLRFGDLRRHALNLLGNDLLPDAAAAAALFADREAVLELDRRGAVVAMRFAADDPALFKHLTQMIVTELQVAVEPGGRTWIAQEVNQNGVAVSRYSVTGADAEAVHLERVREEYARVIGLEPDASPSVDGRWTLALARAGHVLRFQGQEHVEEDAFFLDGRIDMTLTGTRRFSKRLPTLADRKVTTESRRPGQVVVSDEAIRKAMLDRADGLTGAQLLADLQGVGAGQGIADKNRWMWRATGLLRLHPELADGLADVFAEDGTHHAGRALALDLLASVGHERAQAAMRRALQTTDLSADPRAHALKARLGFVKRPDADTAAFVADAFADAADQDERTAWAYTLGAVAGHHGRKVDAEAALALTAPLVRMLDDAPDADGRHHALLALGNAGLDAHTDAIAQHAQDADPRVRRAAATALRKQTDAASEKALTRLIADPDVGVQQAAAKALARRTLGGEHFELFRDQIEAGRIHEGAFPEVMDALLRHRAADPDGARAVLEAMLQQPLRRARLRARIKNLLG